MRRITRLLHEVLWDDPHATPHHRTALCGARVRPEEEAQKPAQVTCVGCLKERLRVARLDAEIEKVGW